MRERILKNYNPLMCIGRFNRLRKLVHNLQRILKITHTHIWYEYDRNKLKIKATASRVCLAGRCNWNHRCSTFHQLFASLYQTCQMCSHTCDHASAHGNCIRAITLVGLGSFQIAVVIVGVRWRRVCVCARRTRCTCTFAHAYMLETETARRPSLQRRKDAGTFGVLWALVF